MSFKREGNDGSLINILKKRRIKDLFSEDIPEDEAKLLSNGRFTCLVCGNNPIFDTVAMLSMHRHGKKHIHYQEIFDAKKRELQSLIRKRQHEEIIKFGKTSISSEQMAVKPALGQAAYNPCVKKGRGKTSDRRQRVNLNDNPHSEAYSARSETGSTSACRTPTQWQDICEQQMSGPVLHEKQLKNIFKAKSSQATSADVRLAPYQSSRNTDAHSSRQVLSYSSNGTTSFSSSQSRAPSGNQPSSKSQFHKLSAPNTPSHSGLSNVSSNIVNNSCNSYYTGASIASSHQDCPINAVNFEMSGRLSGSEAGPSEQTAGFSAVHKSYQRITKDSTDTKCSVTSNDESTIATGLRTLPAKPPVQCAKTETVDKELAAKYRLLQGSGWKKDWDGKWIRDEEAEFDSDEEPPDLP